MASKKLSALGKELGWYAGPHEIFGMYRGYPAGIASSGKLESPSYKLVSLQYETLPEDKRTALEADVLALRQELGCADCSVGTDVTALSFIEKFTSTKPERLRSALERVTTLLDRHGVTSELGRRDEDELGYVLLNGRGQIVPREKLSNLRLQIDKARRDREYAESSYGSGALGALLFGLAGVLVWVLVAVLLNYYVAIIAIGIVWLSYYGYQRFTGKTGPFTKPVLIAVNLLLVVVATVGTYYWDFHRYLNELGETQQFTVGEIFNFIREDPEARSNFLMDLGLAALFVLVGVFYIVTAIDTKGERIEEAERL